MKRILIFLGLKIVEIGGVLFAPFYLGKWNPLDLRINNGTMFDLWFCGIGHLLVIGLLLGCSGLVIGILIANWKWSKNILDKMKGRG